MRDLNFRRQCQLEACRSRSPGPIFVFRDAYAERSDCLEDLAGALHVGGQKMAGPSQESLGIEAEQLVEAFDRSGAIRVGWHDEHNASSYGSHGQALPSFRNPVWMRSAVTVNKCQPVTGTGGYSRISRRPGSTRLNVGDCHAQTVFSGKLPYAFGYRHLVVIADNNLVGPNCLERERMEAARQQRRVAKVWDYHSKTCHRR